jgi:hypothetical protein
MLFLLAVASRVCVAFTVVIGKVLHEKNQACQQKKLSSDWTLAEKKQNTTLSYLYQHLFAICIYIYVCVLDCIGYLSRFGVAPAASLFGFLHLYAGMMQTLWLGLVSCFNIYQYVEIIPPPGRGKNIFKKQPVVANKMM